VIFETNIVKRSTGTMHGMCENGTRGFDHHPSMNDCMRLRNERKKGAIHDEAE